MRTSKAYKIEGSILYFLGPVGGTLEWSALCGRRWGMTNTLGRFELQNAGLDWLASADDSFALFCLCLRPQTVFTPHRRPHRAERARLALQAVPKNVFLLNVMVFFGVKGLGGIE